MNKTKWIAVIFCASTAVTWPGRSSAQQKPFTMDQVLSDPLPTELLAAPSGGKVAWLQNARGVRNIWIAEPSASGSGYESRQITSYTQDDGIDLGELSWTPDAKTVVYARGGDFEFENNEDPNVDSFPLGVKQGVWSISVAGGQPQYLGEGRHPSVSPKGDRVAFLFKGHIWIVGLDGQEKAKPLVEIQGFSGSLRWSPDGTRLAFVSHRAEHSFIAVYSFDSKTIHYLEPSVDQDQEPVWSPDGKRIAFLRVASTQRRSYGVGPRREGPPWSIQVADADTGKGHEAWKAEAGDGSVFHNVTAENQVLWGAGDRLVFPWERDGWSHLYSVSLSGGKAQLLTPGEFEVEDVSLSADKREIVFNSNQDDIDRRHLWKVGVAGGRPVELTPGEGIEWSPVTTSDSKAIVLMHSDARRPARTAVIVGSGQPHDLAPQSMPSDFPVDAMVVPQQVIISSADGMKIHCQLFLPPDDASGKRHPAVIFFHGGSRRQMLLGWHYMGAYHQSYAVNEYLASRGFVVLSVNYRSGIGYGMKFREALNYGAAGATEFNDELGAGWYLRSRADVDPAHIGLWGGSYGGFMTAMGLARASDLFAAGVDMFGVHDWNESIHHYTPSYDPNVDSNAAKVAWESSPLASVDTWRSPVLLVHGDDDRNVPFTETIHLVEALRKRGVDFEELIYPNETHGFLRYQPELESDIATAEYLERHLKTAGQ